MLMAQYMPILLMLLQAWLLLETIGKFVALLVPPYLVSMFGWPWKNLLLGIWSWYLYIKRSGLKVGFFHPSMFSLYSTVHLFRGCNSNLKGGLSILIKIPTPLCPHPMVFVISILCIWFWDIISSHILMCMTLPLMVCMLNLSAKHAWAVAVHLCTHPIFV